MIDKPPTPGQKIISVLSAINQCSDPKPVRFGLSELDFAKVTAEISKPLCSIIVLFGITVATAPVEEGYVMVYLGSSNSMVKMQDIWLLLHAEEMTRFQRVIMKSVI